MTKEEIDKLFEFLANNDTEALLELLNVDITFEIIEEYITENGDRLLENAVAQIEQDNYEYFKLKGEEYKDEFKTLIEYSKNSKCIKEYIAERKKYEIDEHILIALMRNTKEPEFIKKCIEKREFYGIKDTFNVQRLIESTKDTKFIQECIKNKRQYGFFDYHIIEIIKNSGDSKFILDCVKNPDKYGIMFYSTAELIKHCDSITIQECIANRDLFRIEETIDLVRLIIATEDSDFIKKCIEEKEKYGITQAEAVKDLIKGTKDPIFIESCIENREKYGIRNSYLIRELIRSVEDPTFISNCIKNRKSYEIDDIDFVKELIEKSKDIEIIKKCLEKRELYDETLEPISLILSTKSLEFVEYCIENNKEVNLTDEEVKKLMLVIGDKSVLENIKKEKNFKKLDNIPDNMTIGIEIESEGIIAERLRSKMFPSGWRCKPDGSLYKGCEVVSPILNGNNIEAAEDIVETCQILQCARTNYF